MPVYKVLWELSVMMYTKYVLVMRIFYCSTDVLSVIAKANWRACARSETEGKRSKRELREFPRPDPLFRGGTKGGGLDRATYFNS